MNVSSVREIRTNVEDKIRPSVMESALPPPILLLLKRVLSCVML